MMGPTTVIVTKNLTILTKRDGFVLEGASQEVAPSAFFPRDTRDGVWQQYPSLELQPAFFDTMGLTVQRLRAGLPPQ